MKHLLTASMLASMMLLAGCTASVTENPAQSDPEKETEPEDSAQKDKEKDQDDSDQSHNDQNESKPADTAKPVESDANVPADSSNTQKTEPQQADAPDAQQAEIAGKLMQALQDQGFDTQPIQWKTTEAGNLEGIIASSQSGSQSKVILTFFAPEREPEKTFEANTANDESLNMSVMNEWQDNGNTVRIVRNNRANENFVEVLDTKQRLTLHCINSLPEQLTSLLKALQSLGFPAEV